MWRSRSMGFRDEGGLVCCDIAGKRRRWGGEGKEVSEGARGGMGGEGIGSGMLECVGGGEVELELGGWMGGMFQGEERGGGGGGCRVRRGVGDGVGDGVVDGVVEGRMWLWSG